MLAIVNGPVPVLDSINACAAVATGVGVLTKPVKVRGVGNTYAFGTVTVPERFTV